MTVFELNLAVKNNIESYFSDIYLKGELSRITKHSSGHWYFELKDERASIACAMFKGANKGLAFSPAVGDLLELFGKVSLYEASGRYQFIASSMKKAGEGDLEKRFLALKAKLEKEGLFTKASKIPIHPEKIAIICSPSSAALADIKRIIIQKANFMPKFFLIPALTQGKSAPNSLIKALLKAQSLKLDLIILARGGGSREDLFCFNDEELARTIYKLQTPVISAIGHEIDYVISDFVADLRAPTPSAAINILLSSRQELEQRLDLLQNALKEKIFYKLKLNEDYLKQNIQLLKSKGLNIKIKAFEASLSLSQSLLKQSIFSKIQKLSLKLEQAKNILKTHEFFFKKSKDLVSLQKDGEKISPDDLFVGTDIELVSYKNIFLARLLAQKNK